MSEIKLIIEGMNCKHCVGRVQKAIDNLDGVNSSNVEMGSAIVNIDESKLSTGVLVKAINDAGYKIK